MYFGNGRSDNYTGITDDKRNLVFGPWGFLLNTSVIYRGGIYRLVHMNFRSLMKNDILVSSIYYTVLLVSIEMMEQGMSRYQWIVWSSASILKACQ